MCVCVCVCMYVHAHAGFPSKKNQHKGTMAKGVGGIRGHQASVL